MAAKRWLRGRDYADAPDQGWLRNTKYELYEAKSPAVVEQVWQIKSSAPVAPKMRSIADLEQVIEVAEDLVAADAAEATRG